MESKLWCSVHGCLHRQADMESLPVGWTLHTCDPEGDRAGLLGGVDPLGAPDPPRGAEPGISADTHVCDLFHEDAQVG